jgi:hypothetical protein
MKIIEQGTDPFNVRLCDAEPGQVVRLRNGRLYLIGILQKSYPAFPKKKLLINLETGLAHDLKEEDGDLSSWCRYPDAELHVK